MTTTKVQFWVSILLTMFGVTMAISGRRSSMTIADVPTHLLAALAGWAADYVSGRSAFLSGLGLHFVSMVVFCLAHEPWILLMCRGFQGLASTLIYTSGLALIAHSVSSADVGSWWCCPPG